MQSEIPVHTNGMLSDTVTASAGAEAGGGGLYHANSKAEKYFALEGVLFESLRYEKEAKDSVFFFLFRKKKP